MDDLEKGPAVLKKKSSEDGVTKKRKRKRAMEMKMTTSKTLIGTVPLPAWLSSRHGAAMDDLEQWPPVWKQPLEECPEYRILWDPLKETPVGRMSRLFDCGNMRQDYNEYKLFIKQLRETRGYDLTRNNDDFRFKLINHENMETYLPGLTKKSQAVLERINDRAENYGESYVFHDIEKAVYRSRCTLVTFGVKEVSTNVFKIVQACVYSDVDAREFVLEWRFKPAAVVPSPSPAQLQDDDSTITS